MLDEAKWSILKKLFWAYLNTEVLICVLISLVTPGDNTDLFPYFDFITSLANNIILRNQHNEEMHASKVRLQKAHWWICVYLYIEREVPQINSV